MSRRILAIDPGNTHSGVALIDSATCKPIFAEKVENVDLLNRLYDDMLDADAVVIEMVASYGMAVGATVFETCVWIGRFHEAVDDMVVPELVFRKDVKMHHCGQTKAKDSNIVQALVDRFASGVRNNGKGTKADPGWFYGFRADVWQAYALAVLKADQVEGRGGVG